MAEPGFPDNAPARGRLFALSRASRLKGRSEYLRVFRSGARVSRPGLAVHAAPNALGRNRFGVSVGRKFGKAVARNRIRRMLKEAYRLENPDLPQGYDFVCVPYAELAGSTLRDLRLLLTDAAPAACRKAAKRPAAENRISEEGRRPAKGEA